jgi:ech hydrogenase subunit C
MTKFKTPFNKSPWLIHYDASSCNGCDIEVLACLTPVYDVERLGVINTGNPKHADIFLVTGSVNEQNREVIQNIYRQLAEPKVVVAIGICASSGCIYRECYNVAGGVDKVIPVDVYVPGCAARPEAIIDGVVQALAVLEDKRQTMESLAGSIDKMIIEKADYSDMPEILALQKIAYQSEQELYTNSSLAPLNQSLTELQKDFMNMIVLKALVNGKIIGSIRGLALEGTGYHSRVVVHPYFQGRGLGAKLIREIEKDLLPVKRWEVFTWYKSKRNIQLYQKLGYKVFKTEKVSDTMEFVYLEKVRP